MSLPQGRSVGPLGKLSTVLGEAYAEINKDPSPRELVKFGATLLAVLVAFGLVQIFVFHHEALGKGALFAGSAVFVISLVRPMGRLFYIFWMGLGITMGLITSPIVLLVVFLLLITPVGLFFKLLRRDMMKRKLDPNAQSYWEEYPETSDPATYVRQF